MTDTALHKPARSKEGTTKSAAKPTDVAEAERGEINLSVTLQQALVAGQAPARPTDLLALQRLAGNQAVKALVHSNPAASVQRVGSAVAVQQPPSQQHSVPQQQAVPSAVHNQQNAEQDEEHRENIDLGNEGLEAGLVKPMSAGFEVSEKADKLSLAKHGEDWSGKDTTETHQHHMAESASAGADAEFLMSTIGLGIAGKNLSQKVDERTKAKGQVHESVADRQVSIAGGNVTSSAGSVLASGAEVAKGGVEIASALGTVGEAAATTAGTVAHGVALPFSLFNFFRTSRKAHLQRQRADRLDELTKKVQPHDPSSVEKAQTDHRDALTTEVKNKGDEVGKSEGILKGLNDKKVQIEGQLTATDQEIAGHDKRFGELKGLLEQHEQQLHKKNIRNKTKSLVRARKAKFEGEAANSTRLKEEAVGRRSSLAKEHSDTVLKITEAQKHVDEAKEAHKKADEELKEAQEGVSKKTEMKTEMGKNSLTATGDQNTSIPSLQDIAAFSLKKNERGVIKKAVAATGLGLGVVGGVLGIAALAGASLGLAGAIFGGAAAAVGLGVGIYKMFKKFSKRHKEAQAMEAARDNPQSNAAAGQKLEAGEGAWSRALAFWKPVTGGKRDRYATALLLYADHGSDEEKKTAGEILGQLDPKRYDYSQGDGAKELQKIKEYNAEHPNDPKSEKDWKTAFGDGSLSEDQREAITKHIKSKMAS